MRELSASHVLVPDPGRQRVDDDQVQLVEVGRDFPAGTADEVARRLTGLAAEAFGGQDQERVMAAVVPASAGQRERFLAVIRLVTLDWRDVLVTGELAYAD